MQITYQKLNKIGEVAKKILKFANESAIQPKVWLFEGPMGAGKTTLIKALGNELGIRDTIQSPTFALVNEYLSEQAGIIYHFDFYRLKDETEALDMGYEEYFYSGNYCWVEWPTKIPNLLPEKYLLIKIKPIEEGRLIELKIYG